MTLSLHTLNGMQSATGISAPHVVISALLVVLATVFQLSTPAYAGESDDRAQLSTCVENHLTPDDAAVARQLIFLVMVKVFQVDSELQSSASGKSDDMYKNTAALITRLAEQDCKSQLHALMVDKPAGGAFQTMFETIMKPALAAMRDGMPKAAVAPGLGIMSKLDPQTAADIAIGPMVAGVPYGANAPDVQHPVPADGNTHFSRTAISGVPLRVGFETALNPDCSVMGKTVIRVLTNPTHGTATVQESKDFTSYPSNNQRYACSEHRTSGAAVYYKSAGSYTGPDSLSFEVIFPSGVRRQVEVALSVD